MWICTYGCILYYLLVSCNCCSFIPWLLRSIFSSIFVFSSVHDAQDARDGFFFLFVPCKQYSLAKCILHTLFRWINKGNGRDESFRILPQCVCMCVCLCGSQIYSKATVKIQWQKMQTMWALTVLRIIPPLFTIPTHTLWREYGTVVWRVVSQ